MTDDRRLVVSEEDLAPTAGAPPSAAHAFAGAAGAVGRQAGRSWLQLALGGLVLTVAIGIGVVVVVRPFSGPTSADFCKALHHGEADIRAHVPITAPHGTAASLAALAQAFGNIGRYQTMLDDLVDASPPEVHTDMKTARDTFKQTIDAVPGGIRDPLGAFVGVALNNVIHQPSFQHVDAYARRHCGSTVFGTRVG